MQRLPRKLAAAIEATPDPRADEAWFQALPEGRRVAFTDEWRRGLCRTAALGLRERRRPFVQATRIAALWLIADLVAPHGDASRAASVLGVGAVLGFAVARLDLDRLASVTLLLPTWLFVELLALGGLTGAHFMVALGLGFVLVWDGIRREECFYD